MPRNAIATGLVDVILLVAEMPSNISVKTVEVHKSNAMRKLNLRGRSDVVRYAVMKEWLRET